jgi:hypothetical protein
LATNFKAPRYNPIGAMIKINYIEPTSEGDSDKKKEERRFYTCNSDYNAVSYLLRKDAFFEEKKDRKEANPDVLVKSRVFHEEDYNIFKYALNTKKLNEVLDETNCGAFDLNGVISEERKKDLKENLQQHQGIIWAGIVSVQEKYNHKLATMNNAMEFMEETFPGLLKDMKFPLKRMNLLFALHKNTDNRHVHFVLWEKEPTNLEAMAKDSTIKPKYYHNHHFFTRSSLYNYRTRAQVWLDEFQNYVSIKSKIMKNLKMNTESYLPIKSKDIETQLKELAHVLPKKGRLQYNSENLDEQRPLIDKIANMLLKKTPEINNEYRKILALRHKLFSANLDMKEYKANVINFDSFIGNYVIKLARSCQDPNLEPDKRILPGDEYYYNIMTDTVTPNNNYTIKGKTSDKKKQFIAQILRKKRVKALILSDKDIINHLKTIKTDFSNSLEEIQAEINQKNKNSLYAYRD